MISGIDLTKYLIPIAVVLGSAGALWLVWSFIWNFGLGPLGPEAKLYAKLTRLGWLAGIGRRLGQTPIEYGRLVSDTLPSVSEGAEKIAMSYAVHRYGNRASDAEAVNSRDRGCVEEHPVEAGRASFRAAGPVERPRVT